MGWGVIKLWGGTIVYIIFMKIYLDLLVLECCACAYSDSNETMFMNFRTYPQANQSVL